MHHTCSICLIDFEDQEEIIRLPVCNHCFHKDCLQKWIEALFDCPYCRSDIRANLRITNRIETDSNRSNRLSRSSSLIDTSEGGSSSRLSSGRSRSVTDIENGTFNSNQSYIEMIPMQRP